MSLANLETKKAIMRLMNGKGQKASALTLIADLDQLEYSLQPDIVVAVNGFCNEHPDQSDEVSAALHETQFWKQRYQ